MNTDLPPPSKRDFLKAVGIEHLDVSELQMLNERKLDKDVLVQAVVHVSECPLCCSLAPVLTPADISEALAGSRYGRPEIVNQTIDYYLKTSELIDREGLDLT